MASISRDPNGRKRILFVAPDGKRKTIRLGDYTVKEAQNVQQRVERLLASQESGCPLDRQTARWVAQLERKLADKLARVGLIDSPNSKVNVTLAEHVENYISQRTDVEESTRKRWQQSFRSLTQFFGKTRPLAGITAGEA